MSRRKVWRPGEREELPYGNSGWCVTSKVRFPSRAKARANVKRLRRVPDYGPVREYECPHCSGWHLTSQEPRT